MMIIIDIAKAFEIDPACGGISKQVVTFMDLMYNDCWTAIKARNNENIRTQIKRRIKQ